MIDIFKKTVSELTPAEIIADQIATINAETLQIFIDNFEANFFRVWTPVSDVIPQQVFDSFGTKARDLFVICGLTIQYILALKPEYVPPQVPYEYVINDDGTVVVGEKKP